MPKTQGCVARLCGRWALGGGLLVCSMQHVPSGVLGCKCWGPLTPSVRHPLGGDSTQTASQVWTSSRYRAAGELKPHWPHHLPPLQTSPKRPPRPTQPPQMTLLQPVQRGSCHGRFVSSALLPVSWGSCCSGRGKPSELSPSPGPGGKRRLLPALSPGR